MPTWLLCQNVNGQCSPKVKMSPIRWKNCNWQLGKQKISCVGSCEHIYSSECVDKAKTCKHIYKVHSTLKREIKQCKTDLKINEKDETDAVSDEASNISLELQTSEECNRKSDENENVRM